jgi:predicted dehydrogenase
VRALFIASVNGAHAEQTVRAASVGKHVICEKPMANTVDDRRRMVEACNANRVRLMIAYRKYFEPASVALEKLVERGKLGRPKVMYSTYTEIVDPEKCARLATRSRTGWRRLADGPGNLLRQHDALARRKRSCGGAG